jgi:uroporphyrinogen III methyltransferase/synthase
MPTMSGAAILVVGRVAALRDHLRWFDVRPLFGRRVVVTRPREQARELVEYFEDQGAVVVQAPTARSAAATDLTPLVEACASIGQFDWLVLPTLMGTTVFLATLLDGARDIRDLKGVSLCAVGQSAVERFNTFGVRVDVAPAEYRPETIVEALGARRSLKGARVLLPHAEGARDALAAELRKAGADVTEVAAYRTVKVLPGEAGEPDLHKMLLEGQVEVVTFGSPSTVKEFAEAYGTDVVADLLKGVVVACVGPVTAQAASGYGIAAQVVSADHTNAGLVTAVIEHFRG